jgi:hypothetical protein
VECLEIVGGTMAMTPQNVETYVVQWLETATKGNVSVTFAWLTNRMHLHCKVCQCEHTCTKPQASTEIDYSVQEFVKLHAHVGGHEPGWVSYKFGYEAMMNPVYLKPGQHQIMKNIVAPGKIIETDDPQGVAKIDDKPEMAAKIKEQMAKYDAEITEKFKAQAYENKIKILQMAEEKKKQYELMKQETFEKKFGSKSEAELKILEAQLENQVKKDILKEMMKYQTQVEQIQSETPKAKPLKRSEGRKFR